MAYRKGGEGPRARPEGGIVEEVVQQFADKFAFTRELVQNSIDAGATRIDVAFHESHDRLDVVFSDDGAGMTLEVIQGPLLTVFSSTKEDDKTKIGKYGIGFKSVLAVDPSVVAVETHRTEGAYRVRLLRDHTYEIEELAARAGSGTQVTLQIQLGADDRKKLMLNLRFALERWCRHVTTPLSLAQDGAPTVTLNVPLSIRAAALFEVQRGDTRVVIGPTAGLEYLQTEREYDPASDFAGFYSRGLTLHETAAGPPATVSGYRFKVDCPDLSCTVSRDDVRRDRAFTRAMKIVEASIDDTQRAVLAALEHAAKRFASEGAPATRDYLALLAAACAGSKEDAHVALLEPWQGRSTIRLSRLLELTKEDAVGAAAERTKLTELAASSGACIVRIDAPVATEAEVCKIVGVSFPHPAAQFAVVAARHVPGSDVPERLARVLRSTGRKVTTVLPVELVDGLWRGKSAFVAEDGNVEGPWLLPSAAAAKGQRVLVRSDLVKSLSGARQPSAAVSLLARVVLLEHHGSLSASQNDALLAAAAEAP